ncbi:hypothetical protein NHN26_14225 [Rhodovulum tesquicola]|uniref:hypothetical protein n=1 Tax=Rhodovulum tesquicola TaxID=540254 RepID=UPI00209694AD|nr:hypothetical protein [Rhodovulum tesquicola]MCO8146381.1 hypothetical protein [Rhodovulum tesquicola]
MQKHDRQSESLEDLAARGLRLGREVALLARDMQPGADSQEVAYLQRCLSPLRDDKVFDRLHEGGFEAALTRLRALRDAEELGRHREFMGFQDPEGDAVGIVQEVVEYSDHGRALAGLVDRLETVLALRRDVLDRLEAERLLLGRT